MEGLFLLLAYEHLQRAQECGREATGIPVGGAVIADFRGRKPLGITRPDASDRIVANLVPIGQGE